MATITVARPTKVEPPRAAAWTARVFLHLLAWFESAADRRAQHGAAITRATEAAAVRAYAGEVDARVPRFAAELRAAADRHDRGTAIVLNRGSRPARGQRALA